MSASAPGAPGAAIVVAAPAPSGLLDSANPVLRESQALEVASLRASLGSGGAGAGSAPAGASGSPPPPPPPPAEAPAAAAAAAAAAAGGEAEAAPYYWEAGGAGEAPIPVALVHHAHYWFSRVVATAEYVGDFFSEFFGLYNSRYEWAMELERRHQEEAEAAELLEARRKRYEETKRLNGGKALVGVPVAVAKPAGAAAAAAPEAAALLGGGAAEGGGGGGGSAAGVGAVAVAGASEAV